MYGLVLIIHSLVRWLVLITGLVAAARGISGWRSRRPWKLADERAGFWFLTILDLQFLLGLLLYGVLEPDHVGGVPRLRRRHAGQGGAGSGPSSTLPGCSSASRSPTSAARACTGPATTRVATGLAAIFFTLALVVILASIPWPNLPQGRPLLRW